MSDSLIAQSPCKHDAPAIDFSNLIAQTWQKPMEESPKWAQIGRAQEIKNGVLELGNWQELYGKEALIAQASPAKQFEVKDRNNDSHKTNEAHAVEVKNGTASPEYAAKVRHGLEALPAKVREELAKNNVEIVVYKNFADFKKAHPNYKDKPEDQDGLSLTYSPDSKHHTIVVFETLPNGTPISSLPNYRPDGLLRHEIGHMHNRIDEGRPSTEETMAFLTMFSKLAESAKPADKAKHEAIADGLTGPFKKYGKDAQEMYAELYAIATGGGSDKAADAFFKTYFGDIIDIIKKEVARKD